MFAFLQHNTGDNWNVDCSGSIEKPKDEKITLTLFEEPIKQILAIQNEENLPTLTEEMLTDNLLNLPAVNFTYNTQPK